MTTIRTKSGTGEWKSILMGVGVLLFAVTSSMRIPHQSEAEAEKSTGEVTTGECLKCHGEQKGTAVRGPHGKSGFECRYCHGVHDGKSENPEGFAGSDPQLLSALCVKCHTGKAGDSETTYPSIEEFLGGNCSTCHDSDPVDPPLDWLHPVRPASAPNEFCTDCHSPHTKYRPDLAGPEDKMCLDSCHGEVRREFERLSSHWGLSREIRCVDCHGMHGVDEAPVPVFNLESIPSEIAAWNWVETNETCFGCHREGEVMFGLETGFRDDPSGRNLHALHVIDGLQVCVNCHDPHGSSNSYLLRTRLFDRQPMEFFEVDTLTRRCYVECHSRSHFPEEYRRAEEPVF